MFVTLHFDKFINTVDPVTSQNRTVMSLLHESQQRIQTKYLCAYLAVCMHCSGNVAVIRDLNLVVVQYKS